MLNFDVDRKYIENEFQMAVFDKSTGLSSEEVAEKLREMQNGKSERPRQLVCADMYAFILDNAQLEINEHTPFSVKMNIGVVYSNYANADVFDIEIFKKQREKILKEKLPEEFKKSTSDAVSFGTWTDYGHTVPNWNNILKYGFTGILDKATESRERLTKEEKVDEKAIVFLDSVIICYKAILRIMKRMYEYSLKFNTPMFTDGIKKLMSGAPETLYEVLLLSMLYVYFEEIGPERARSLGDIDRLYYPYYLNDLKNGKTKEELDELFRYFFIHFTATKRFAQQPFTIGGCDKDGNDCSNELSLRILEIYDGMNILDPKIHIRYHKNIDRALFTKAVSLIRNGHSSICIINDEAVFRGYEKMGIPREDSQHYVILGCYEPFIMGIEHCEVSSAWLSMPKILQYSMNGGRDILNGRQIGFESKTDFESFEDFLEIFLSQLKYYIDFTVDFAEKQGFISTLVNPSPIYSSTLDECLEKGRDIHEYPLKYNNIGINVFGLATVVDSLCAIKKFVFDKKEISFADMTNAIKTNWNGFEEIRRKIENDEDKYGNNRDIPDDILVKVTTFLKDKVFGKPLARGGVLRLGLESIDFCVVMGKITGATPDGRMATMPLSKNICACEGKDTNGITAFLQTVLKIDSTAFLNGAPCDFVLHPTAVEGEKGLCDFLSLIEIFFSAGGFAMHGNVFNKEMLIEAQQNPEKYKNLQVRVCGWNEYFVKLNKATQDMFIKQCEVI